LSAVPIGPEEEEEEEEESGILMGPTPCLINTLPILVTN
jgi:hypothetical protein